MTLQEAVKTIYPDCELTFFISRCNPAGWLVGDAVSLGVVAAWMVLFFAFSVWWGR